MAALVVITGGAGAGKSTLVHAIASHGHPVVREAAIEVIEDLVRELGHEAQRAWRREHQVAFQRRVAEVQTRREAEARAMDGRFVVCDRGLPDGRAYCERAGNAWPDDLLEAHASVRYAHAFVLDTPVDFDPRRESGRDDDLAGSVAIGHDLERLYRSHADGVTRLADGFDRRLRTVLEFLEGA